ncbi:neprilysin-1-like [Uloborus diversus]|uniref:neprilysin-1-like n=1 Tax=Uloborus diversus TaxID=327109 RepID=UPI00240A141E|nr:neprilysin-1-like [Uloborus diversus]
MDSESDACSNFYDFTCGQYGRAPGQTESVDKSSADVVYFSAKRLLESRENNGVQSLDSVKALYSACMEFGFLKDGQSPEELVRRLLATFQIGKWPLIENFFEDEPPLTLEQRLTALALVDVPVAFRMEVVPDNQVPGSYLVKLSPGGPRESMRTPEDIRSDVLLRDGMRIQFIRLGSSEAKVGSEVEDIVGMDAYFAQVEQDTDVDCNTLDLIPPADVVGELQRLIPEADWKSIISIIQEAAGLVRPFAVELHCRAKIRDYIVHLDGLPFRSLYNYLGWRFFSKFSHYMGPDFMQPRSEKGYGVVPRWRSCLALIEKFAGPALADALTAQQEEKIHAKANEIVNATLSTTERLLSGARWLSSSEKSRILQKVV